jgi:replicative DNA helicase
LAVLRGLTSKDKRIAGKLLAGLDSTYFHNPEAVAGYTRICNSITRTGEPPAWRDLCEDPALDESVREFLSAGTDKVGSLPEVDSALSILNKYRQLRGLYLMSEAILESLQAKKVDNQALIDKATEALAKLRVAKSAEDIALHFGTNNNSMELVKELIYGEQEDNYLPTGFSAFDDKNGGILLQSLFVIAGNSGGGKCLTGEAKVALSDGTDISLEEIWNQASGEEIPQYEGGSQVGMSRSIGLTVKTVYGDRLADQVYKTLGPTVKITLMDGTILEGRGEHRVLILTSKNEAYWKRLDALTLEDEVLTAEEFERLQPKIMNSD